MDASTSRRDSDADLDDFAEKAGAAGHRPVLASIAQERAARARGRGDRESWQRWLEEAQALHQELGADAWAQQITHELDEEW